MNYTYTKLDPCDPSVQNLTPKVRCQAFHTVLNLSDVVSLSFHCLSTFSQTLELFPTRLQFSIYALYANGRGEIHTHYTFFSRLLHKKRSTPARSLFAQGRYRCRLRRAAHVVTGHGHCPVHRPTRPSLHVVQC